MVNIFIDHFYLFLSNNPYYNYFQPQCYPSSLRRGIDFPFYDVGFDLGALWAYRLYMYSDLLKICNKAILEDPYKNSAYCTLKSNTNFEEYKDKDMVCFNDTEQLDDYDVTKERFIEFLNKKFPKKSSYEKE